jgi:predicted small integral membrane protein
VDSFTDRIAWMAWTWQTVVFFAAIATCLAGLTALAVYRPETPRVGVLGFATTRGDRFFVSLLVCAFIFVGFIRFGGQDFTWPALAALAAAALMFRFA